METTDSRGHKSRDTTTANGHTITGDPHRDGPIDWERVRREVGEE